MPEIEPKVPGHDPNSSSTGMAGLAPSLAAQQWSADANHPQRTPGAYEWWHFEGIDSAGNGVVAMFFDGLPFHPDYLAAVSRAQRRQKSPFTIVKRELQASYYPAAYFAVYQGGRPTARFLNLYPCGTFEGSAETPELRVGPNRLTLRTDGTFGLTVRGYPYEMHGGRPCHRTDQILTATLTFAPSFKGVQQIRPFRPNGPGGQTHTWVIAAPHGRMTGRVQHIAGSESVALIDTAVDSLGYHDHVYGQGPLGNKLKRLAWGHAVGDTWTAAWHWAQAAGRNGPRVDGLLLFERDCKPVIIESPTFRAEQKRSTPWLVGYPGRVTMYGSDAKGNSVELLLQQNALMDNSPFHARLDTAATLTVIGKRQYIGAGITNVLQIPHLHWPVFSDMVLMAILPIRSDDPLWRQ